MGQEPGEWGRITRSLDALGLQFKDGAMLDNTPDVMQYYDLPLEKGVKEP